MTGPLGEFGLIERFFAPLAGPEGLGLGDDAAVFAPSAGYDVVVTCDTMVSAIHFLADDPPDSVGHKLLAVNLSDLAAMGAVPSHYLLAASWPSVPAEDWLAGFVDGLARMQQAFDITLIGGDTTRTDGPLTLTVTAFGSIARGAALRRSSARPGDLIFASGTLGDAALGLHLAAKSLGGGREGMAALTDRLHRPMPRVALGQTLVGVAHAAMDISDGLIGDLAHIAEQSGVGAEIQAARLPLSEAAAAVLAEEPDLLELVLTGGDDYELLFTAPPESLAAVLDAAKSAATPVTEIGVIRAEPGIAVLDRAGQAVTLADAGFRHF